MGVTVKKLRNGDGRTFPKKGQKVYVHYDGFMPSGEKIESSRDSNEPFCFIIGKHEVTHGWEEAVSQMSVGEKARIICTPDNAYSSAGHPSVAPLVSDILYEVELLRIE